MESIVAGWIENQEGQIEDFVTKINNCRHEISSWQKDNQPYRKDKIKELQHEVSRKLQEAYKNEEEYWHQKSQKMWHSSGDLNTKFYHAHKAA